MDELINSVSGLVSQSLDAAGDLAGDALNTAAGAAANSVASVSTVFAHCYQKALDSGMSPEDAADAAERATRQAFDAIGDALGVI